MHPGKQPGIGLDYDGTIADTNALKSAWIRQNLGLEVPPWRTDRTLCVPLIGLEAYERMGKVVYSPTMTMQADEVPGAAAAIRELSCRYRLYIVTARNQEQIASCRAWLEKRGMARYIAGYLSSAERASDGSRVNKSELCRRYGIQVLIDDDERHLRGQDLSGLRRILLKNGCDEALTLPEGIGLASSWPQVLRLLGDDKS